MDSYAASWGPAELKGLEKMKDKQCSSLMISADDVKVL